MGYLSNSILALNNGKDAFLLNWRRLNETMSIDTSEYSFFQSHIIEALDYFIPVGDEFFLFYKWNDENDARNQKWGETYPAVWLELRSRFSSPLQLKLCFYEKVKYR